MILLKDQFFPARFYKKLSVDLKTIYPSLNEKAFYKRATAGLVKLELKERLGRTADVCREFLPDNYNESIAILYAYTEMLEGNAFSSMFLPEFVARYGLSHYALSIRALKDFTRYSSSELAIRAFLQLDFKKTIRVMCQWSEDQDFHVRRLASEGARPRLPWATQIDTLKENPEHVLPILNNLRADKEKYVQKSIANHLNDISKDHPDWMLDLVRRWGQKDPNTAWIIKHASRSLIKQGNSAALSLFGVKKQLKIKVSGFVLESKQITMGSYLSYSFNVTSLSSQKQKLIIDYNIFYKKKSGELKPKVFKLKELELVPGQKLKVSKRHLFKAYSTRKHYPGVHRVEIIVNGNALQKKQFTLSC